MRKCLPCESLGSIRDSFVEICVVSYRGSYRLSSSLYPLTNCSDGICGLLKDCRIIQGLQWIVLPSCSYYHLANCSAAICRMLKDSRIVHELHCIVLPCLVAGLSVSYTILVPHIVMGFYDFIGIIIVVQSHF